MSKRMGKRGRGTGPFVQIFRYMMQSPAWRDLTPTARALYVELKSLYNGKNNGELAFSARDAGFALGLSKSSASRYFAELEKNGFIVKEKLSSFAQKRLAIEWLLTELKSDLPGGDLPSKDFIRWPNIEAATEGAKKQKPVPSIGSIGLPAGLEHLSPTSKEPGSPTHRPANRKLVASQSHQRATSTILPGGIPENRATEPAVPAVMGSQPGTPFSDASPVAEAISADSESRKGMAIVALARRYLPPPVRTKAKVEQAKDPLKLAILKAYPEWRAVSQTLTADAGDSIRSEDIQRIRKHPSGGHS